MIDNEHDPSGLYDLPDYTKDLIRISRIDIEYNSNDNRSDHENFIARYKKLIGCKENENKFTDDINKILAIRIIAYNQILHCYKRMDEKDIYADLTEEQASDRKMCEIRRFKLVGSMYSLKKNTMKEHDRLNADILMTYFVSYSGNKFIETTKLHYPK